MGSVVKAIDNADDLQGIRALAEAKNYPEAMKQLDAYLDKNPGDAQGRFLKGILLSDQKRSDEAIKIFVSLTEDYPELPEPYNNLAVLYAGNGKYLKARDALLVAIKTHPSYATAHENLGDIYAMMATEAYKKALSLDEKNKSAESKLAMIRDLFPKQAADATNLAAKEETGQPIEREDMAMAGAQEGLDAPIPSTSSSTEPSLLPAPEMPTPDVKVDVLATLQQWAKAWSDKDVDRYIGFYAPTFIPGKGMSLSSWQEQRRKRISAPRSISIEILEPNVIMLENNKARVRFIQKYRSNTYQDTTRKAIEMIHMDGSWRFVREQAN